MKRRNRGKKARVVKFISKGSKVRCGKHDLQFRLVSVSPIPHELQLKEGVEQSEITDSSN